MVHATTRSAPPPARTAWASFLAPIGVSVVVVVPLSTILLASAPEPVDRSEAETVNLRESSRSLTASHAVDEVQTARDAPETAESNPQESTRRLGFSPVLGDEEEQPSSEETTGSGNEPLGSGSGPGDSEHGESSKEERVAAAFENARETFDRMPEKVLKHVPMMARMKDILGRRRNSSDESDEDGAPVVDNNQPTTEISDSSEQGEAVDTSGAAGARGQ